MTYAIATCIGGASCNGEYGTDYSDDAAGDAFGGAAGT